jgi:hypothetical protein
MGKGVLQRICCTVPPSLSALGPTQQRNYEFSASGWAGNHIGFYPFPIGVAPLDNILQSP